MMDSFEFDNGTGSFADIYRRVLARTKTHTVPGTGITQSGGVSGG